MNSTNGRNKYSDSGDESLIKEIAKGDPEALSVLMDRYLHTVSRAAYRILCDIPESEILAEELFKKVWRNAGGYDFQFSVPVWIYRMIYNLSQIHLRRLRLLDLLSMRQSLYETSIPQPMSPEEDFITKETWEIYCRAVRSLTFRQRAVFVLSELEELSTEDVSLITGMRSDRIRDNLIIARERIKSELAKYGKVV